MFVKHTHEGRTVIIIAYVDDIILTRDHKEEIVKLKSFLAHEFKIKDLGNLKYFFGMEIARSKMGIAVSQCKYVLDLLKETRMLSCKPIDTPMDCTIKLGTVEGSALVDIRDISKTCGELIYLSHLRSNITFFIQHGWPINEQSNWETYESHVIVS